MSLGLSTWLLHSKGLAPEKFALGALPVTSLKTKLEWIQAWLLNSNTKECCKMGPSGFRLMVFKVTYGTVKKQGVLSLVTIQCGGHMVMICPAYQCKY